MSGKPPRDILMTCPGRPYTPISNPPLSYLGSGMMIESDCAASAAGVVSAAAWRAAAADSVSVAPAVLNNVSPTMVRILSGLAQGMAAGEARGLGLLDAGWALVRRTIAASVSAPPLDAAVTCATVVGTLQDAASACARQAVVASPGEGWAAFLAGLGTVDVDVALYAFNATPSSDLTFPMLPSSPLVGLDVILTNGTDAAQLSIQSESSLLLGANLSFAAAQASSGAACAQWRAGTVWGVAGLASHWTMTDDNSLPTVHCSAPRLGLIALTLPPAATTDATSTRGTTSTTTEADAGSSTSTSTTTTSTTSPANTTTATYTTKQLEGAGWLGKVQVRLICHPFFAPLAHSEPSQI